MGDGPGCGEVLRTRGRIGAAFHQQQARSTPRTLQLRGVPFFGVEQPHEARGELHVALGKGFGDGRHEPIAVVAVDPRGDDRVLSGRIEGRAHRYIVLGTVPPSA